MTPTCVFFTQKNKIVTRFVVIILRRIKHLKHLNIWFAVTWKLPRDDLPFPRERLSSYVA